MHCSFRGLQDTTAQGKKVIYSSNHQSINQHHKNVKIPSPGGRSVYTNKTDSVLSLRV